MQPEQLLIPSCRILFGLIFLNKLYFCWEAHHLVWAHRKPFDGAGFHFLMAALFASGVLFTVGLFSGPASLAMFLLYLFLFRYASLFGLEDVSFQAMCFYFLFAGAGGHFSLDSLWGLQGWGRFLGEGRFPEIALAGGLGCIFMSAGTNKLVSPIWRRGLGSYYFFLLPQFRRADTSVVTNSKLLLWLTNHPAVVMELGFLPAVLFLSRPLGLIFWGMAIGFSILLFTLFVLTWIGETMTLGLVIVLPLLLDTSHAGLLSMAAADFRATEAWPALAVKIAVTASLACTFWVSVFVPELTASWGPVPRRINVLFRYAARFTWGLVHLKVFTEIHMQGPVVFRTFLETASGPAREVFRVFTDECAPGPKRSFHPSFYEVLSYKVGEACMELDECGAIRSPERRRFIERLAAFIAGKHAAGGEDVVSVLFKVNQIIPPGEYRGADDSWLRSPWVDAFRIRLDGRKGDDWTPCCRPILQAPTGRSTKRLSFKFDPEGY